MSVTPIPADLASVAPVLLPLPLPAPARLEPEGATAPVDVVAFSPDGLSQLAAGAHEMDRLPRPLAPQPLGQLADKIGLAAFDLASASPVLQSRTAVRAPIISPPDIGTLYRPAAAPS